MMNFFARLYITLFFCVIAALQVKASAKQEYNVLYVQSYTDRDTWSKEMVDGLQKGFIANSLSVNITVEYLNSRHWNADGEEETMRRICRRATERGTDLIITSNDEALYSLLACGDSLPRKVPVVFFGLKFPNKELMDKYPNVTGLTAKSSYTGLLEVARYVFPTRTNVVLISEDTTLGRKGVTSFKEEWNSFIENNPEYSLNEFNITHDPMTAIVGRIHLSVMAEKSIIIVPYWGLFMPAIAKVSKAPTFTLSSSSLMQGGFGAMTPDLAENVKEVSSVASKILTGSPVSSFPIRESNNKVTFDNKQLQFFHVDKERLPKEGVIINQTYLEKYGVYLVLVYSFIIALLVFLIIRLFVVNRRESRKRMHAQTRLLIQARLVEQRNEFDNVFHSIRDAVITYDNDLNIHFVNRVTLEMLGISEMYETTDRPFEGQPAATVCKLLNNGEEILLPMLERVKNEGVDIEIPEDSFVQIPDSKKYFPVSGEVIPIRSQGHQTGLAVTFRNISDQALQKRFFNLAIEESSIYPWQYELEGDSFIFSAAYISRMGFEDAVVSRAEMDKHIHPEDLPITIHMFEDAIKSQKQSIRLSFRQKNEANVYEWWEFRLTVLRGVTIDAPLSVLGVCQSIQQFKSTEEELILARDKALQADKLKSAFLANMSHEIRTPLNAIVGFSDLLKDIKVFSDEEVQNFIAIINKNCELLLALISDILDLSRVESGSMDFQFSSYYLPILVQDVFDSQRLNMPPGVELVKEMPQASEKTINTDSVRLKQVLNNLINNAAKFTVNGSITLGYTEDEPGFTTFYVKDTGAGISKEDQERIFERFYKIDSFTQGAGLGLSICQTIVGRLQGKIWVESELGVGTTFYVRVPDIIK